MWNASDRKRRLDAFPFHIWSSETLCLIWKQDSKSFYDDTITEKQTSNIVEHDIGKVALSAEGLIIRYIISLHII